MVNELAIEVFSRSLYLSLGDVFSGIMGGSPETVNAAMVLTFKVFLTPHRVLPLKPLEKIAGNS